MLDETMDHVINVHTKNFNSYTIFGLKELTLISCDGEGVYIFPIQPMAPLQVFYMYFCLFTLEVLDIYLGNFQPWLVF